VTPPAAFATILTRSPSGNLRWRHRAHAALRTPPPGLRSATVNHANNLTHSLAPRIPPGSALVLGWVSAEAAAGAWRGPLRGLLDGPGRFSLDGPGRARGRHLARVDPERRGRRADRRRRPGGGGRPRGCARATSSATTCTLRADPAHYPGHRGSVDISFQLPFEHTSVSPWVAEFRLGLRLRTRRARARCTGHELDTHRAGVYLRVIPLASTGGPGVMSPAYPALPPALRH